MLFKHVETHVCNFSLSLSNILYKNLSKIIHVLLTILIETIAFAEIRKSEVERMQCMHAKISILVAHYVGGSAANRPKDSHQLTSPD